MPRIRMESITPQDDGQNYFTLYWLDGRRTVIKGDTIEQAFAAAGFGGGAIRAVDWFDNGVSETHRYDKATKQWVEFKPFRIDVTGIDNEIDSNLVFSKLEEHHAFIAVFPNKCEYQISYKFGKFAELGWVHYIEISYGEYHQGSYGGGEDDEEDHHFMVCAGEYMNPARPDMAAVAYTYRLHTNPALYSNAGTSLENIKAKQEPF